jgi:CoA:oxalate CoA-transferase
MGGGVFTALGILSALHERERSGEGQMVDVSMLDCQIAFLENAFARYFATGDAPERIGTRHPVLTPFQAYPTRDGYLVVAAARDPFWQKFCKVIQREDLVTDPRFKGNQIRTKNHKELEKEVTQALKGKTTAEWVDLMIREDIPCGPVNRVDELAQDPHTAAREMIAEVKHSKAGNLKVVNSPIKLSRTPVKLEKADPELGENTEDILTGLLGYRREDIAGLREEKAI